VDVNKKNIVLLCGGQSTEHEISLLSARNVLNALDDNRYQPHVIYITRQGLWYVLDQAHDLLTVDPDLLVEERKAQLLLLMPGDPRAPFVIHAKPSLSVPVDCVFPVLHGTRGEDGAPQGLLDMLGLPYVGSDVIGSALCIEKHISKQLLERAGIATVPWRLLREHEQTSASYSQMAAQLGSDLVVKPTNLGSSVGVFKVHNEREFFRALSLAFRYSDKLLVEQYVEAREIECSVLGNDEPSVSLPGEIVVHSSGGYSYEAKYCDANAAKVVSPADLTADIVHSLQQTALRAYQVLECQGMARVDFFLLANQQYYVNELNTIPGFTNISMYPKNWQVSGIQYSELLDHLIDLAISRWQRANSFSRVRIDHQEQHDDSTVSSSQTTQ